MQLLQMSDVDLCNKRVMIREDLNVPIKDGKITNDKRILAALPTIKQALKENAAVILLSHLGRPSAATPDHNFTLAPLAPYLSEKLAMPVRFIEHWIDGFDIKPGEVVLCENVRFLAGETTNDQRLANKMASLCDVFVMDAFASAHRAQASTYGVIIKAPVAVAGPLLLSEIAALTKASIDAKPPIIAIIGGAKVSTKLLLLKQLIMKVDYLFLGGGIANTFLAAQGFNVGQSLYEPNLIEDAKQILTSAAQQGCQIPIPVDVVVADSLNANSKPEIKLVSQLANHDIIGDIGPQTSKKFTDIIAKASSIIWNGPLGVFEYPAFAEGTKSIAHAVAHSTAFSLAGGGDTIAAIDQYNLAEQVSYISTGGGAFLEFLEGRVLPAIDILQQKNLTAENIHD